MADQKAFKSHIDQMNSNVWSFHIKVPIEISKYFLDQDIKRLICRINDQVEFHCALMPEGKGQYFININKELRKQLEVRLGDSLKCVVKEDISKYGMPLPEEMEVLFEQDEEADRLFHDLTSGKQRTLLYTVGKPKSTEVRLKKALVIIEYLKSVNGQLDFKELNQAFKEANESGFQI